MCVCVHVCVHVCVCVCFAFFGQLLDVKQLSSDSRAIVQQCQDRIMASLADYVSSQYPNLPLRFPHILLKIVSIRLVSQNWLHQMNAQQTMI